MRGDCTLLLLHTTRVLPKALPSLATNENSDALPKRKHGCWSSKYRQVHRCAILQRLQTTCLAILSVSPLSLSLSHLAGFQHEAVARVDLLLRVRVNEVGAACGSLDARHRGMVTLLHAHTGPNLQNEHTPPHRALKTSGSQSGRSK